MIKRIDNYLIDENNNKADISYFGDEVKAKEALSSLVNCYDCVNSLNLMYCRDLVNCGECEGCAYCKDCVNCTGCVGLEGCSNETGNINHSNYNKLRRGI